MDKSHVDIYKFSQIIQVYSFKPLIWFEAAWEKYFYLSKHVEWSLI